MTLTHAATELGSLLGLATAAARAIGLAVAVGLGLRIFRVRSTSARLFAWTAVLYAALAIPLLGSVLPGLAIPVPAFFKMPTSEMHAESMRPVPVTQSGGDHPANKTVVLAPRMQINTAALRALTVVEQPIGPLRAQPILWSALVAVYLGLSAALLLRLGIGLMLTQRLIKSSNDIRDARVMSRVFAAANGLVLPRVRESSAISVPVTVGPIHSSIILPSSWRDWEIEKLEAVITHEMSHVMRHDALTQCIALLHRAIFWFSPLAWWLNRHIVDLAEQASDEAALCRGVDRNHYARTLLGFFEALQATPQRVWWQGVSMAHAGHTEERLEKILAWRGAVSMGMKKSALILVIALTVPAVYLAASVRPTAAIAARSQQPAPPVPGSEPRVPPEPAAAPADGITVAPMAGVHGQGAIQGVPASPNAIAGVPAVPPIPAMPAMPAHVSSGKGYWYSYGFDDEQRFVIVTGKSDSLTMSGSSEDAHHVEKLRKLIPGDFIWFQRDEKSYIIRDQAIIDRARKLWAPQEELGKKQEELGRQQEALGKQQEELGAKMEKVQVKVPDLTAQLDKLRSELKSLSSGATQEQIGNLQSEIGEIQSQLGEVQSHAGDQQSKVGEEMGELGEKQGKLGEQQGELGRQQGELAEKASKEMKQLLDEAIKNGKAQPEAQTEGSGTL